MGRYRVVWTVDVEASSAQEAACLAWEVQTQIGESTAQYYEVADMTRPFDGMRGIDLSDEGNSTNRPGMLNG